MSYIKGVWGDQVDLIAPGVYVNIYDTFNGAFMCCGVVEQFDDSEFLTSDYFFEPIENETGKTLRCADFLNPFSVGDNNGLEQI